MAKSASHLESGAAAEAFAARALERQGHRILLRNARTPQGEIDLLTLARGTYHVVEVKARRRDSSAGTALEALSPAKLARVARAGRSLLAQRRLAGSPCVLLGAAVTLDERGRPSSVEFHNVEEIQ